MADAVQPFRQDMQQEAADELVDSDSGGAVVRLALIRSPGFSVPEGGPLAVECDDPAGAGVVAGRVGVSMAERVADHLDIRAALKKMGGRRVTRAVEGMAGIDAELVARLLEGPVQGLGQHGPVGRSAVEYPKRSREVSAVRQAVSQIRCRRQG